MKFSLHYTLQSDGRWVEEYRGFLQESSLGEKLNFSAVYVGEHHFSPDGWSPAPFIALSAAAAVTSRIRLGTDIVVLPLHNPFEIAEQASALDVISNGRMILGVGLGYRKEEYKAFGKDIKLKAKLYENNLKSVKQLLEGHQLQVGDNRLSIYPRPVQKPRPPLWIAAKSEEAVAKAAHRGDAWIMDPVTDIRVLEHRLKTYRDELNKLNQIALDFPLRREVFISDDENELKRVAELMLESYRQDYYQWGHLQDREGREIDPKDVDYASIREDVLERMIVCNSSCATEKIDMYRKRLGVTELLIKMSFPGITHEMRVNSMKLIAEKVMPALG
ncbi:MAG: LLM class flavin-dependent oxidoreductase [Nitrososphaerota archaeon]|nr:LLM class flavin-dependent oxidoreductase [Nitrososphaerota archaeon]MDG6932963.1 LLM class flavin-dependent oxidoreductase [Nitrososphaerota archaeon]MDG6936298.1 LLM class flavin-dependent oxidoreductase [Nitrososphaerota archaeon]MDG6944627.1 LLM class flavin-dependent oxidoreductase [Nitrososphaerota archaeon]